MQCPCRLQQQHCPCGHRRCWLRLLQCIDCNCSCCGGSTLLWPCAIQLQGACKHAKGAEYAFNIIGFKQHTRMLRSNPRPPGKFCLSIDPGTQNAGVCAFNSTNQTVVYWNRHKLLDVHEQVVRSTDQAKRYLGSITDNVEAALKTDDYWVLVEEQPWDSDSRKGVVFNLQLQQAIVMYYLCKGKSVRVLSASERYKFLGIQNWQQMTRHFRKVSTANAVRQLLKPRDDSSFAGHNQDIRVWQAAGENQHDMADALGQVLCYFYRNKDAVAAGRVVEAELTNRLVAPEQLATSSAQQQQPAGLRHNRSSSGSAGPSSSSHKTAKHDTTARHIRAKALLQQTITKLQAEHPELSPRAQGLAQQQSSNTEKLYRVYQTHRNSNTLQEFLRYLSNFNQKGTNISNQANLNARLTHLLQR
jgi:hypothetical protein